MISIIYDFKYEYFVPFQKYILVYYFCHTIIINMLYPEALEIEYFFKITVFYINLISSSMIKVYCILKSW